MARKQHRTASTARGSRHADLSAPLPRLSEDEVYEKIAARAFGFLLVLDGIEDPHNLGACLRSANAAGVDAVLAPRHHAVSVTTTVRNVAAGAAEHTPFVQVANLARAMTRLREAGLTLVGTGDAADRPIYEVDLTGPLGIVMGAEGKGLRRLTAENCDVLARIPMSGDVDCLNVSVAAGVCLFEAVRQRQRQRRKAPGAGAP